MVIDVETALEALLEAGQPFRFSDVEALVTPDKPRIEELVAPLQPEPAIYDSLLEEEEIHHVG